MRTLYKSLPKNMSPHGHKFVVGKWYKENNISICNRGFHACKRAVDAMGYVNCEVLAKVEVKGKSEKKDNKECWSEMRIIKTYKWTKKDSVALAIYSAELVLENFEKEYPNDDRPRKAIEAAKRVLEKDTKKNRDAARSAAWSAESARSAESAARSAAWSAESAESAARSAARSAESAWSAESAAWSAESAARSAAWSTESAWSAWSAAWSAARSAESEKCLDKIEKWIHNRIGF